MVTGVGAIIGYGILRSLKKTGNDYFLIGTDIFDDAAGRAWADNFIQAPLTSSAGYKDWLTKTVIDQHVELLIPGIEQDLHFFSDNRDIFEKLDIKVALNDKNLVDLSRDKWSMHEELKAINSPLRIKSLYSGSYKEISKDIGVPFLLKPRKGYASKGIVRIKTESDFLPHEHMMGSNLIAQPIVGSDEEEYTVSLFGNGNTKFDAFISMRRKLSPDGSTQKAWISQPNGIYEAAQTLCTHFKPVGPTNMQFRKDGDTWKLLEINPRISSSTSIRTAFGYNESQMCVDFYLGKEQIAQPSLKHGYATRYIEDIIFYDSDNI